MANIKAEKGQRQDVGNYFIGVKEKLDRDCDTYETTADRKKARAG